jgi:hypothetical protein
VWEAPEVSHQHCNRRAVELLFMRASYVIDTLLNHDKVHAWQRMPLAIDDQTQNHQ